MNERSEAAQGYIDLAIKQLVEESVRTVIREELEKLTLDFRSIVKDLLDSTSRRNGEYLPVEEAAKIASVNVATVRDWLKKGYLQKYHAGPHLLRVNHKELIEFLTYGNSKERTPGTKEIADKILHKRIEEAESVSL